MKHEHEVTIRIPEEFSQMSEEYQKVKQHFQAHKPVYVGTGLGLLVGLLMGGRHRHHRSSEPQRHIVDVRMTAEEYVVLTDAGRRLA